MGGSAQKRGHAFVRLSGQAAHAGDRLPAARSKGSRGGQLLIDYGSSVVVALFSGRRHQQVYLRRVVSLGLCNSRLQLIALSLLRERQFSPHTVDTLSCSQNVRACVQKWLRYSCVVVPTRTT